MFKSRTRTALPGNHPPDILLSVLLLCVTALPAAATGRHQLPAFHAQYAALFMGMKVAEGHYDLSHTDDGYKFTQKTRLYGLAGLLRNDTADAVSYVEEKDNRLLLQRYEYRQRSSDDNLDETYSISWDKTTVPVTGSITGSYNGRKINLISKGPVWEPLSFQLPLMIEASADKKEYPYRAILRWEIDTYHFVLTATPKVHFAGRDYQALEVVRTDPRKGRNRQLHIWLIPELHNIPYLIENYRDGKLHSRIRLEQLQINNGNKLTDESSNNSEDEF